MTDDPGRAERELARFLIGAMPASARRQLQFRGVDLEPAAEHVLYTALRRPEASRAPAAAGTLLRGIARPVAALTRTRPHPGPSDVVVLVTQPVHARLFRPIAEHLARLGERPPLIIAARTGEPSHVRLDDVSDGDLRDVVSAGTVPHLVAHALGTAVAMRRAPSGWSSAVDQRVAARLAAVLSAAIPRLALDVARLSRLIDVAQPRVVVCFSESGLLARLAPAATARRGVAVLDLPHAEAADPWGTSGAGYTGVAVFGPRAATVMRTAGIAADRIVQIGPLGYDDLQPAEGARPVSGRVVFASQPVDEGVAYRSTAVKRLALESAISLALGAGASAVHVLPHPTEDERALRALVASVPRAPEISLEAEPAGRLHALLPDALALVTVSSQSVFEAGVSGVPAVVVHPAAVGLPVTYVADGIALGASSVEDARRIGESLRIPERRAQVAERARRALADRLGPLDGRAAERAARWIHEAGRVGQKASR